MGRKSRKWPRNKHRGKSAPSNSPVKRRAAKQSQSLILCFNTDEFKAKEIGSIISTLSDFYSSLCGDVLVIKSAKTFEFATEPMFA